MKVQIIKDEHSPTIVVKLKSQPNQLDHFFTFDVESKDILHSLHCIIKQHNLNTETIDESFGFYDKAGAITKKLIIKDVTDAFETDLQHWVFTGDIR
jgi:hypothetical protein